MSRRSSDCYTSRLHSGVTWKTPRRSAVMKRRHRRVATELMPSVRLYGQLPAAVAKGGLARPPFAQSSGQT